MQSKRKEITVIAVVLILQTLIYVFCCGLKSYIHMDEAYSLGLASYDKTEIKNNEDFYNTWHTGEYYDDYLSLQEDEFGKYSQVYENQKNDVHPPFYYLLLRFAMGFAPGSYSVWPAAVINIICYGFVTVLNYVIFQRALKDETRMKEKAILLSFLSSVTMASITNVLYIRMYAVSALNVSLITYLHIKLRECNGNKAKWLILISFSAVVGFLTHYYYLFYLFALFLYRCKKYIKAKDYKSLKWYILSMVVAGVVSLAIFPYAIEHMFFGYQGEGFLSRLFNPLVLVVNLIVYLWVVNEFVFNLALMFLAIAVAVLCYYRKNNRKDVKKIIETDEEKASMLKLLLYPTLFYFLFVSAASPYMELRYIVAIGANIFFLVFYYFCRLLKSLYGEKTAEKITCAVLAVVMLFPLITKQEPQSMYYAKRADVIETIEEKHDVPAIYVYYSANDRFLDDILLFAKLDKSYIAKDGANTEEHFAEILKDVDLSKGLIVFINNGQDDFAILKNIKISTGFQTVQRVEKLNSCDVFYLN